MLALLESETFSLPTFVASVGDVATAFNLLRHPQARALNDSVIRVIPFARLLDISRSGARNSCSRLNDGRKKGSVTRAGSRPWENSKSLTACGFAYEHPGYVFRRLFPVTRCFMPREWRHPLCRWRRPSATMCGSVMVWMLILTGQYGGKSTFIARVGIKRRAWPSACAVRAEHLRMSPLTGRARSAFSIALRRSFAILCRISSHQGDPDLGCMVRRHVVPAGRTSSGEFADRLVGSEFFVGHCGARKCLSA